MKLESKTVTTDKAKSPIQKRISVGDNSKKHLLIERTVNKMRSNREETDFPFVASMQCVCQK